MDSLDYLVSLMDHLSVQVDSWVLLGSVDDLGLKVNLTLDLVFRYEVKQFLVDEVFSHVEVSSHF